MEDYKSPYKAVGLSARSATRGRIMKKQQKEIARKTRNILPTRKQISGAKLREFSDYAIDFTKGYDRHGKSEGA